MGDNRPRVEIFLEEGTDVETVEGGLLGFVLAQPSGVLTWEQVQEYLEKGWGDGGPFQGDPPRVLVAREVEAPPLKPKRDWAVVRRSTDEFLASHLTREEAEAWLARRPPRLYVGDRGDGGDPYVKDSLELVRVLEIPREFSTVPLPGGGAVVGEVGPLEVSGEGHTIVGATPSFRQTKKYPR